MKGILIFGYTEGCGKENSPGIYTDVYQYRDWIVKNSGNSITSIFALTMAILFFGVTCACGRTYFK